MEVTKNEEPIEIEDNSSKKILESEIVCDREENNSKKLEIICEGPFAQECEPDNLLHKNVNQLVNNLIQRLWRLIKH